MGTRLAVHFWGVRGSIAVGGPDCVQVGGNTSCVEVSTGDEILIFDAGTGLFRLGQAWGTRPTCATLFFSHFHWDHIQGFPFFAPAYKAGNTFRLYGPTMKRLGLKTCLACQMRPPNFPVRLAAMRARLEFRSIASGDEVTVGRARVRTAALNHPQGCLGYRVSVGCASLVYASDTEPLASGVLSPALTDLARDADLLIHDAQYTDDEYEGRRGPERKGWGHSTVVAACQLARATGVRRLVLFHHDPSHSDRVIEGLEHQARSLFTNVVAAREGMTIEIAPSSAQRGPHDRCVERAA
jgi:phosphoribosyl 1,2-cyclic phosphodiesterase